MVRKWPFIRSKRRRTSSCSTSADGMEGGPARQAAAASSRPPEEEGRGPSFGSSQPASDALPPPGDRA